MLGEAASFFPRSTSGTNAAAEKKPMAIQPHELSKGSKLGADRRLVGRLVDFQDTDQVLSCYLVCGPGRKQVIQIEAWRELKEAAKQVFHAGQLVSLTCVSLSLRKADKMKYSYSGVQVMVRFDKHLQVAPADEESSRSLCGFPELKLADLARTIPETSFKAASCLREGLVRIKCRVLEANAFTPKSGKSLGKALVEEKFENERWQAELVGFAEFATDVAGLQAGSAYLLTGIAVQASQDKNGFAFKWVKGSAASLLTGELAASFLTGKNPDTLSNTSQDVGRKLSNRSALAGNRSQARAIYVSASTLDCFLPSSGCRKFDNAEVWEVPWVTLVDINPRRTALDWHYTGCSECFKSACAQHEGAQRRCYAIDVQLVDHTGLLEAKMFTAQADEMFASAGITTPGSIEPQDQLTVLQTLRGLNFSVRLAIMEEEAWQSRAARNYLQVLQIRMLPQTWTGTAKPLLRFSASGGCSGIPAVRAEEVVVDAAEQITGPKDCLLDCVELLVQIGNKKPQNRQEADEAGLRVSVEASDLGSESRPKMTLSWLVSTTALLDLGRELLPNATFRIIARPVVAKGKAWQVLQHSSNVDAQAWQERLQWQRQDMDMGNSRKRVPPEEFTQQTPNSKVQCVRNMLASPSYTAE